MADSQYEIDGYENDIIKSVYDAAYLIYNSCIVFIFSINICIHHQKYGEIGVMVVDIEFR